VTIFPNPKTTNKPVINTTGNRNLDLDEPITLAEKSGVGLLQLLLPPQVDNEKAADI
jgi:hypothetical protein